MISGIIICHGQLAFELINSVRKILGHTENLYPFSNDDLTPEKLYLNVKGALERNKDDIFFVFVDLRGGSCWRVAKMLAKEYRGVKVISGVNVPMLISFISKRGQHPDDELVQILNTDALRGIIFE